MSETPIFKLIIDQIYDLQSWFPLFFGGIALVMLGAMLVNSRFVERLGLRRLLGIVFVVLLVLELVDRHRLPGVIKKHTTGTGRTLVYCCHILSHSYISLIN